MKRFLTGALALVTIAGGAATAVSAQPYGERQEMRQDRGEVRRDRGEIRDDRRELRQDRREFRADRRDARRHWRQGERLDRRYGAWQTVDWRANRLPAPRRGYHWVRSGDDYVQAALVGGLIAAVIAANN